MSVDSPISADHKWFIGEKRVLQLTVVDSNGDAINIAGWTLEWILRRHPGAATADITKTTEDGIVITGGAAGECEVTIAAVDTADMEPATYFHTLGRTTAGSEGVLSFGLALLQQAATR